MLVCDLCKQSKPDARRWPLLRVVDDAGKRPVDPFNGLLCDHCHEAAAETWKPGASRDLRADFQDFRTQTSSAIVIDESSQPFNVDRLCQLMLCSDGQLRAGRHDGRNAGNRWIGRLTPQKFPAIHSRHHQVEQDQAWARDLCQAFKCLCPSLAVMISRPSFSRTSVKASRVVTSSSTIKTYP
jgi:hypothetical protein